MIGLCGAHRTGKTTLAIAFAEAAGIPFVETKTSEVMLTHGFDPKADYNFESRLYIQERILDAAEKLYAEGQRNGQFITDRTPLDMLAYTMADIQRENVSPVAAEAFERYLGRCFEVTNRYLSSLVVIQPGIPLVEDSAKAPCNIAYVEHINSLVIGLVTDERALCSKHFIRREMTNIDRRIAAIFSVTHMVMKRHLKSVEDQIMH